MMVVEVIKMNTVVISVSCSDFYNRELRCLPDILIVVHQALVDSFVSRSVAFLVMHNGSLRDALGCSGNPFGVRGVCVSVLILIYSYSTLHEPLTFSRCADVLFLL